MRHRCGIGNEQCPTTIPDKVHAPCDPLSLVPPLIRASWAFLPSSSANPDAPKPRREAQRHTSSGVHVERLELAVKCAASRSRHTCPVNIYSHLLSSPTSHRETLTSFAVTTSQVWPCPAYNSGVWEIIGLF